MISEQTKQAILTLRQQNRSYAEIAQALLLSANTVKSVCRRNHTAKDQIADGTCKNCGRPLPQPISYHKAFCDDKCRTDWWNRQKRRQPYRLTCLCCGSEFISYGNRNKKFCGRDCYIRSRYGEGLP